jgi:serine/threonine protein kinase
MWLQRLSEVTG